MDKVSVVIPTFNRFKYLMHAIKSVKEQTYKNIEIIVVNDCSTQKEYYTFDYKKEFGDNFMIIHLPKNSQKIFGKVCGGGNSRNIGMMMASGKYIAFLDDDDYFMPTKLEKQIKAMKEYKCSMSCVDSIQEKGQYSPAKKYEWYPVSHEKGCNHLFLKNKYKKNGSIDVFNDMFKDHINVWKEQALNVHNCTFGGSAIVIEKTMINKAGYFTLTNYAEDWDYWKRLIKYSNCVYISEPLTYIDLKHGDGQLWKKD
jgi:glycosyltransferase involved in cell wall biosynthesis